MEDHNLHLNWHFFATSHGKGAVDGVGGMLKHHVWQRVKSRKAFVTDALSFTQCAVSITEKVNALYIPKAEILSETAKLEKRWENIKCLPKTHQMHCIRTEQKNVVKFAMTSDKEGNIFHFKSQSDLLPVAGPSYAAKSNDVDIQFGKWVLVDFTSDRGSSLQFVGQIIGKPNKYTTVVKFLKKCGLKFVWPEKEDISEIDITQIRKILSEPVIDSRERLCFSSLDIRPLTTHV